MTTLAIKGSTIMARPLKVLVPLITRELAALDTAGLEYYHRVGEMLLEAKGQVARYTWGRWLSKNFELSRSTAERYMRVAQKFGKEEDLPPGATLKELIGESEGPSQQAWKRIKAATKRLRITGFLGERQSRRDEIRRRRLLAVELITLGYRALATRLHPDHGGSKDAMGRLSDVRDELLSVAERRRFL